MDRRTGPTVARYRIALALAFALCAAGCGGGSYVQAGSTVNVQGTSALGALIAIGVLGGYAYESERQMGGASRPAPPMEASRTVQEQDCSRPIENRTANLKCR